ncbi:MAG: response regulator [Lachnospiraceae bacterium]|nr:response regulator [Lachnospiraceae bacterium]
MMNFKSEFYERLFATMDSNAVMMKVGKDGDYFPIWCSEEFLNMVEGTEEEYFALESGGVMNTIHPEDKEEVAYLFKNLRTMDGTNHLDVRKQTVKGNWKWVKVRYAFLDNEGEKYAYCTYEDITELKESQAQTQARYTELNKELNTLADNSLAAIRSNLTKGVVEEVRGTDLYDVDRVGADVETLIKARMENMPIESDRRNYVEVFDLEKLKEKYYLGEGPTSLVIFSRRQSGRQCFIKYSASMRKDPVTGDVIVLGVETEYTSEKVTEVLNDKVLAQQYDMVCYIVGDGYGVVIGDAANIKKGSIFPKERNGNYRDYVASQVLPALDESTNKKTDIGEALSPERVAEELAKNDSYTVDVNCLIDGESFTKRFTYYAVDMETRFFILLKSDITEVLLDQRKKDETQTVYRSMLEQFNAIADESLTVTRFNLTTGIIEDVRGRDLYDTDHVGGNVAESIRKRAESFLVQGDETRYQEVFSRDNLIQLANKGEGPVVFVGYCHRQSGRQCFVKFSLSASKNPVTGDVIAFGVETECNTEMINDVLDNKILAQQYDMVTYLVGDYYGVVIGDAANIEKGSIFPKEKNGVYMDYVRNQVWPVVAGTEKEKEKVRQALLPENISRELEHAEFYTVDVNCEIDGEIFNKRFMYFVVDREAKYYILLKSDITEVIREQANRNELLANALDEAERANVAKTAFLSSMSHEIRTPMNAIIGLDEIALQEPEMPPKIREYLEKIGGSARHLLNLINDILDMSRIESGRMTIRKEEFDFSQMLEQINTMIGGQCRDKGLNYDCRIKNSIDEYFIGDDMKLKQVIINILGNAVKFTPEGGTVTFTVEQMARFDGKATLRFEMRDTGIGMDKAYLPKLFDAFSQEDEGKANKYGSTGLGMAITKNIVDMMNGNITVDSEKGKGTTFTVTVTLKSSDRENGIKDDIDVHNLKVLVIDDDPVDCEHAKIALEEIGITPDLCMSGKEALEHIEVKAARHEAYNLILVDWKMPEQDGVAVTREIRKIVGAESAVVVLTAYNWEDIESEAKEAGVDHFMAKPLFSANVLSAYKTASENRRALQEEPRRANLAGRRILLAEDIDINAQIMGMLLGTKQMEADRAENGQIAVDKFQVSEIGYYDAILMDVRMPVLDGLGATSAIRRLDRPDAKEIPIIAMTANAFDEDVQRSLQAGMNAHLSKPVEPEHLFETLETLIRQD